MVATQLAISGSREEPVAVHAADMEDRSPQSSSNSGWPGSSAPGSSAGAMPRLAHAPDTPRMPQPQVLRAGVPSPLHGST